MTQRTTELQAQTRTQMQKATKLLRAEGIIPAQVYGHGTEPRSVQVRALDFQKAYRSAGESTLVRLIVDGQEPLSVLIQQVQHHPLHEQIVHVDFYKVNLKEKTTAEIPLVFEGESKAVKELSGVLVKSLDHVEVECLPTDLVHELIVDISKLSTFEDAITVADIVVPSTITILTKLEEVVATVQPPISEAELKALDEKPVEAVETVEVVTTKPQEDEKDSTQEGSAS